MLNVCRVLKHLHDDHVLNFWLPLVDLSELDNCLTLGITLLNNQNDEQLVDDLLLKLG